MQKVSKIYLAFCWAFFIFKLISFPIYEEKEFGFSIFDKFVHLFLFAIFTWLLLKVLNNFLAKKYQILLFAFLISISYALIIEYVQIFIPGRDSSFYDFVAGLSGSLMAIISEFYLTKKKPKLLLHVCCIGCGAYVAKLLQKNFFIELYFYNPNIYPITEYEKRLAEAKQIAKKFNLKLRIGDYDHKMWLKKIKGHEHDKERNERCWICYQDRLEKTAKLAKKEKIEFFSTTLTISPHKDAEKIIEIGKNLEKKYKIKFLSKDFKKHDGFKKSVCLSKKLKIYRQNYCGCEFSIR